MTTLGDILKSKGKKFVSAIDPNGLTVTCVKGFKYNAGFEVPKGWIILVDGKEPKEKVVKKRKKRGDKS